MSDRFRQILLLLRSLHDYDATLPTSTGNIVRRQAKAGEGPTSKKICSECHEGVRRIRGVESPCFACGGFWLEKGKFSPGRGWSHVDAYTERKVGTAETELVSSKRRVRCDACGGDGAFGNQTRCARCNGSGEVDTVLLHRALVLIEGRSSGDPRLDAMERRREAGSYDELLTALGTLRAWPDRLRNGPYLLGPLHCYRVMIDLEKDFRTFEQLRYDLYVMAGLAFIESRMPGEIRVPSWTYIEERRRRERLKADQRKRAAA